MTHYKVTKWLLSTAILSMSLLTVMAGAAIAPALGVIQSHFAGTNPLIIQMLVSVPALFIIFTSFVFSSLCRRFDTRRLVLYSLLLYVVAGAGAFFLRNIWLIMVLRALLGISVGVIMPLSTGLLVYFFGPEKQAKLMGLSSAMNYLGGVVATLITGILSNVSWNLSFLVYLMGLIAFVLCFLYMPAAKLPTHGGRTFSPANVRRFLPYITAMLLVMTIFFIYPTNFSILSAADGAISPWAIAPIMAVLDVVAFWMGLQFPSIFRRLEGRTFFLAPLFYLMGYMVLLLPAGYVTSIAGSIIVGFGSGLGIPLIYATATRAAGREATTTVLPMLSATMYLGQFVTPLVVSCGGWIFPQSTHQAYLVALVLAFILLIQACFDSKRTVNG